MGDLHFNWQLNPLCHNSYLSLYPSCLSKSHLVKLPIQRLESNLCYKCCLSASTQTVLTVKLNNVLHSSNASVEGKIIKHCKIED